MTADEPWNAELLRRQEWSQDCGARCGDRESLRLIDTPRTCPVCGWQPEDQA